MRRKRLKKQIVVRGKKWIQNKRKVIGEQEGWEFDENLDIRLTINMSKNCHSHHVVAWPLDLFCYSGFVMAPPPVVLSLGFPIVFHQ